MSLFNKIPRLVRYSRPFRERFGFWNGLLFSIRFRAIERANVASPAALAVPGWSQPVSLRPQTDDLPIFRQLVLRSELEIDLQPRPTRIVDGGANVGLATSVFANRWPGAAIVSIELEPANFAVLEQNARRYPNICPINAALWNAPGFVTIAPQGEGEGECSFRVGSIAASGDIPTMTVGQVLDQMGWDTVDLVKLDIEGAEREVLADAANWLHRTRHVVIELHERFAPGCLAAFESVIDRSAWHVREHGEYMVATRRH